MAYIGIDLHANRFTAHFLGADNKGKTASYLIDDKLRYTQRFLDELNPNDYVFIEASTNTFAFSDVIKDRVKKVVVVDPYQFRQDVDRGKKTDKIDAKKLAKEGKYHVQTGEDFLPAVYIVNKKIRKLRSLFTTYTLVSKEIVMVRNRIYSLFKENLKPYTKQEIFEMIRHDIDALELAEEYKVQVRVLFEIYEHLTTKRDEIKRSILVLGEHFMADVDILVSISGVSVFIALAIIADYGTIDRFAKAKQFSRYLRSTPRSEISNERRKDGKTYKRGRKLALKMILQGLHHSIRENTRMRKFFNRLKKGKGKCKARMAITRKLFVIMFFMLKKREYYQQMNKSLHDRKMTEYKKFLEQRQQKD